MSEVKTFEDAIRFAIRHEEEEARFYEGMAGRSRSEDQKQAMLAHAAEEYDHKRRLESILANGRLPVSTRIVADADMKIAEMLTVEDRGGHIGYEDALILAAKREKQASRFYRLLADTTSAPELAEIFSFLAEQEAKHGKQIEQKYDDAQREG
ncbi:MAG: ferritin family protein [Magnetococcales bacterium]|nr:ferritin family protein [Magnetococcales bacterium]MBF0174973.1 ferritin family protein [Magnetococcales bacterium]MBF0632831.1 ferritin family protein [Magnetococcales bacterium]